jgi:hypothetical protein
VRKRHPGRKKEKGDALMLKGSTGFLVGFAILSAVTLSACSTTGNTPQAAVNKGNVPLEAVRVGTPETIFKEAIITFIPDQFGTTKEKNQYLSRFTDASGGQYVVQAKDDLSYEVSVVHREKTLTKEEALAKLKRLLPTNVTSEPELTTPLAKGSTVETYKIGEGYTGSLAYKDKTGKEVSMVTVTRVPGANVATTSQPQ